MTHFLDSWRSRHSASSKQASSKQAAKAELSKPEPSKAARSKSEPAPAKGGLGAAELSRAAREKAAQSKDALTKAATDFDRRLAWARTRAWIGALWRPPKGDASLPQWLHLLVGIADDGLRVPGTRVRFGLDAFLGTLLPGAGDALGGVTAVSLMYVAWRRGAPRELLFRMLGNATVDVVFGSIPIVGDLFDLGFHANRRNLSMLEDHLRERKKFERASRTSAFIAFGLLALVMLLALAGAVGLVVLLWRHWQGG